MSARVLSENTYSQLASLVATSVKGVEAEDDDKSDVVEFEVVEADGLFVGFDPHGADADAILTVYLFIADTRHYTTQHTSVNENQTVQDAQDDILDAVRTGLQSSGVDTDSVNLHLQALSDEGQPGRYYVLNVPVTVPKDTVSD